MGERLKNVNIHFWISPQTDETIRNIATAEGKSLSSIYRDLVEKGLAAGGYISGQRDMAALVRDALQEVLQPQVERLASITAKGTQISAAAFFLAAYSGRLTVPDYLKEEFDEVARMARKLGVEYLKLSKDKNMDEFISRGLGRIGDDAD